jgi:hypothetical protein
VNKLISENSIILANGKLASENPETGEAYLIKDRIAYGLNPVGKRIWELIQQPVRVSRCAMHCSRNTM